MGSFRKTPTVSSWQSPSPPNICQLATPKNHLPLQSLLGPECGYCTACPHPAAAARVLSLKHESKSKDQAIHRQTAAEGTGGSSQSGPEGAGKKLRRRREAAGPAGSVSGPRRRL